MIFEPKFVFLTKIFVFHQNINFSPKCLFWTRILIFDQYFLFLTKIFIFDQNFYLWKKLLFLTKNNFFDQIFYFCSILVQNSWRNLSVFDFCNYFQLWSKVCLSKSQMCWLSPMCPQSARFWHPYCRSASENERSKPVPPRSESESNWTIISSA